MIVVGLDSAELTGYAVVADGLLGDTLRRAATFGIGCAA